MALIGIALVVGLAVVYGFAVLQVWRAPFRALGILVAGMAFHNFLVMVLLRLNTPGALVRIVQAWKEGILILLGLLVLSAAYRAWRAREFPHLRALDYLVAAFTVLTLVYLVLPHSVLHTTANLHQRLLGARIVLLLPLLYLYGRVFAPVRRQDVQWVAWITVGAGAIVGLFGLVELWLVPTRVWLDWGVNLLSSWLGFSYPGPKGLPPNFFQTTGQGLLLRRMVSTYVSPLGIAYAGLVVAPLAAVLVLQRQASRLRIWLAWAAAVLFITGILFSLTRLALALLVFELLLVAGLFPRVRLLVLTVGTALGVAAMLFVYPQVGPLVDRQLDAVPLRPAHITITSGNDASLKEHSGLLAFDLQYVLQHPLGTGLGSSVHRFGEAQGTGESAVFDMFGDLGFLGGALYLLMYAGAVVFGLMAFLRVRRDRLLSSLPLVASIGGLGLFLITLTSDVWGDFATTFLFWWAAGGAVSMAGIGRAAAPVQHPDLQRDVAIS
jgi:hypothetical protein